MSQEMIKKVTDDAEQRPSYTLDVWICAEDGYKPENLPWALEKNAKYTVAEVSEDGLEAVIMYRTSSGIHMTRVDATKGIYSISVLEPKFKVGDVVICDTHSKPNIPGRVYGWALSQGRIRYRDAWGTKTGLASGFGHDTHRLATEEEIEANKHWIEGYEQDYLGLNTFRDKVTESACRECGGTGKINNGPSIGWPCEYCGGEGGYQIEKS